HRIAAAHRSADQRRHEAVEPQQSGPAAEEERAVPGRALRNPNVRRAPTHGRVGWQGRYAMTRLPSLLVASVIAAGFARASNAQSMPAAAAKAAAHRAADAASAHVEAEQRPDGPSRPTAVVSTVSNGDVRRDTVKSLGKKQGLAVGTKSDTAAVPT